MRSFISSKRSRTHIHTRKRARTHTHTHVCVRAHTQTGTSPLVRIEAYRLLARCRGQGGDAAGACEALECAVSESQAARYVFTEISALREMLPWIVGDVLTLRDASSSLPGKFSLFPCAQRPPKGVVTIS